MAATPRPLVRTLPILFALQLAACGADPAPHTTPSHVAGNRIARQDLRDAAGTLGQYWRFEYDALGQLTVVRGYNGAGALTSVSTTSWANELRTRTVVTDGAGAPVYATDYAYLGGVLDRATTTYVSGTGDTYTVFVFADGKKQTSTRYLEDGTLQGRNDFSYDTATGRRILVVFHDATGAPIGSATRTYVEGQLTRVQSVIGAVTLTRSFTWEAGPLAVDYDVLFEF